MCYLCCLLRSPCASACWPGEANGIRVPGYGSDPATGAVSWLAYGRIFSAHPQEASDARRSSSSMRPDAQAQGLMMAAGPEAEQALAVIHPIKWKAGSSGGPHETSVQVVQVG